MIAAASALLCNPVIADKTGEYVKIPCREIFSAGDSCLYGHCALILNCFVISDDHSTEYFLHNYALPKTNLIVLEHLTVEMRLLKQHRLQFAFFNSSPIISPFYAAPIFPRLCHMFLVPLRVLFLIHFHQTAPTFRFVL